MLHLVLESAFPKINHGLSTDDIVKEIASWLKKNTTPIASSIQDMKTRQFIDKCVAAGGHCKNASGGAYVISNKSHSIRISKKTKKIPGPVVREYLKKLALNETSAGISIEEFREGVSDEREQIYRYMAALRQLART